MRFASHQSRNPLGHHASCINVASRNHAYAFSRDRGSARLVHVHVIVRFNLGQLALMCVRVRRPSLAQVYTALHLCKSKSHNGLDFRSAMPPADRVCVRSSLSRSCIHGASKSRGRRKRGQWWVMMFPSFGVHS